MPRLSLSLFFLLVGACDDAKPPTPVPKTTMVAPASQPSPAAQAPAPLGAAARNRAGDAAAALRLYYELIAARRYEQAWRMRSGGATLAAFVNSFEPYRSYKASVGTPSLPVESGGWIYVEVPVQIFGTLRDGDPVATAGSVTMRRATSGDRAWRIHGR